MTQQALRSDLETALSPSHVVELFDGSIAEDTSFSQARTDSPTSDGRPSC